MRILFPGIICFFLLSACNNKTEEAAKNGTDTTKSDETKTPPQSEFADEKYTAMGKQGLEQFDKGDIDGWLNGFAENAVYLWSSGDSLVGKKAIGDYWKNRRAKVLDSLSSTNDIWLPIKVNRPQKGPDIPGIWLLNWHQVSAKYKNGKKIAFWVHIDAHYNNEDKVDRYITYVDRSVINAAVNAK